MTLNEKRVQEPRIDLKTAAKKAENSKRPRRRRPVGRSMGNEQSASSSHAGAAAMHPMMMVTAKSSASSHHRSDGKKKKRSSGERGSGGRETHAHRQSVASSSSSSSSGRLSMSSGSLSFDLSSRRGSVEFQRKASNASVMSVGSRSSDSVSGRVPRLVREEAARDVTLFEEDTTQDDRTRSLRLKPIPNRYETIDQVQRDLKIAGLETSKLVVAIDYTKSNRLCGEKTFGGRSLHEIDPTGASLNPYESVISSIGRVLEIFNPSPDAVIPVFGFGDAATKGEGCFPLFSTDNGGCASLAEVLQRYRAATPSIKLSGPRSFAPAIRATVDVVRRQPTLRHHVLVLITSGVPASEEETRAAVAEAATWPISIVVVGVGDGPWDAFEAIEGDIESIQRSAVPNFQFVDFYSTTQRNGRGPEAGLAYAALAKIPDQAKAAQRLGLTASAY